MEEFINLDIYWNNGNNKLSNIQVNGWEKIYHAKIHQIKTVVIILVSEKVDFRSRNNSEIKMNFPSDKETDLTRKYKRSEYGYN